MSLKNNSQPESNDYAIGAIVFDRFRIMEVLGSGSRGRVYRAMDTVLKNPVALKVLITESRNERALVRFQSEAKLASKMNHKNIAAIYDFGLFNGVPFLSMELVQGDTLESLLKKQETLTLSEFYEIFTQVCYAVMHAHNNSIVHRDIKPSNIVVEKNANESFSVKVLDFGVAKSLDNAHEEGGKLTPTGNLVGSPHYMSPEQAQGLAVTTKSDNYSLGCVMWHCLTGEPPFHGDTAMETIWQHINESADKLNEILDQPIPDDLASIIERLLSKTPEERPSIKDVVIPALMALQENPTMFFEAESPAQNVVETNVDKPTVGASFTLGRKSLFAISVVALLFFSLIVMTVYTPTELPKMGSPQDNAQELVRTVEFVGTSRNQEALKGLGSDLTTLTNRYTCKDDDLAKLINNQALEKVDLADNFLTDKCFVYLAQVPKLKVIILNRTRVATLEGLEKCIKVVWLELKMTDINDQSLQHILPLKKLEHLRVSGCNISDNGVSTIANMTRLTGLDLTGTKITSKSADYIVRLPKLSKLGLRHTNVDEAAVRKILMRPNMYEIEINECPNISAQRIAVLEQDFPTVSFSEHPSVEYRLVLEAQEAAKENDYDRAMPKYDKLIQMLINRFGPNDIRVAGNYMTAGLFAGRMKRMDVCEKYLNQAITISDIHKDNKAVCNLLDAESAMFFEAGNIKKGIALLERATILDEQSSGLYSPTLTQRTLHLAERYRSDQQFAKAVPWFERTILLRDGILGRRSIESIQPIVNLGECYRSLNRDTQAMAQYKLGLSIFADRSPMVLSAPGSGASALSAYAGSAAICSKRNDLTTALKYNDQAIELFQTCKIPLPNKAALLKQRARLLKEAGRLDEAKETEIRAAKFMAVFQKNVRAANIKAKTSEKNSEASNK